MAKSVTMPPHKSVMHKALSFDWVTSPDLGLALLFIFLAVLPVIFATRALENFEYPKTLWLRACMLCFMAPVLVSIGKRLTTLRGQALFSFRTPALPIRIWVLMKQDLLSAGVVLIAASASVSTLTSLNPRISFWGEQTSYAGLMTILAHVAVYFVARAVANSVSIMERLLCACLLAGLIATVFAFLQFASVDPIGWEFTSAVGAFARPFGTLGHPNHLGAFLAMLFPLIGALAWPRYKRAMLFIGFIFLAGMLMAMARAAWLGLATGMSVWLWIVLRQGRPLRLANGARLLLAGGVLIALLFWLNPRGIVSGFQDRLANFGSGWTRLQIWQTSLDIFREHPVFGSGPDTFQLAFTPRRTASFWEQEWNSTPTRAHNEILHVLATQGLTGIFAVLVFVGGLIQTSRRALRLQRDQGAHRLALALVCGAIIFLVLSLFSFTAIGYGPVFMVFAAFLNRLGMPALDREATVRWFRPALLSAAAIIVLLFIWNLSMGLSSMPGSFWPVILVIGLTLAGGTAFLLRAWPEAPGATTANLAHPPSPAPLWLSLSASIATAFALVGLVVIPLLAQNFCVRGDERLSEDPTAAVSDLQTAVVLDPAWDIYRMKLASSYERLSSKTAEASARLHYRQDARLIWDQLIQRTPGHGLYHINRGLCLASLCKEGHGSSGQAFASLDQGLRLDPSNPTFFAAAADAALRLEDYTQARSFATAGLERDRRYAPLLGQIGYLYLRNGDLKNAVAYLEKAYKCNWDGHADWQAAAHANLAFAYHRTGNHEKAEAFAYYFLVTHGESAAIRLCLAEAQEKQGRLREAYDNYRRIVAQTPSNPGARSGMERLSGSPSFLPVSRPRHP